MLNFYLSMIETEEDRDKFQKIFDNYEKLIYKEAWKLTNKKYDVDDIVQDTFLDIVNKIKILRYDNEKEFASIICVLTQNCGYAHLKKIGKYTFIDDIDEPIIENEVTDREKIVMDSLSLQEALDVIAGMNPLLAGPLRLKVLGYSSNEIALLLNITPNNARIRIHRARNIVGERLGGR